MPSVILPRLLNRETVQDRLEELKVLENVKCLETFLGVFVASPFKDRLDRFLVELSGEVFAQVANDQTQECANSRALAEPLLAQHLAEAAPAEAAARAEAESKAEAEAEARAEAAAKAEEEAQKKRQREKEEAAKARYPKRSRTPANRW